MNELQLKLLACNKFRHLFKWKFTALTFICPWEEYTANHLNFGSSC